MTELAEDEWLSGLMGMPSFRLIEAESRTHWKSRLPAGKAFVFAKLPPASVEAVKDLSDAGFALVDTSIVLEKAPGSSRGKAANPDTSVSPAVPEDFAAATDIAGSCFEFSRFHLDPLVPDSIADAIKREWVASYCAGKRGAELLVAKTEGRVSGFLAVLTAGAGRDGVATIDLIGVAAEWRRRGVADALVSRFIQRWEEKARVFRVGTQLANQPSLRLYQNHGFKVVDSSYVMHAHFLDGQSQQ